MNLRTLTIGIAGLLLVCSAAMAYSGDGSKEFYKGNAYLHFESNAGKYLKGRGYDEAARMSRTERLEEAVRHFDNALSSRPSETEEERLNKAMVFALNQLSLAYREAGELTDALHTAKRAVNFSSTDPILWLNLANYQVESGNKREASYSYEKAIEIAKDASLKKRLTEELVDLYFEQAMSDDKDIMNSALRLIENGLYEFPDNTNLLSKKAKALYTLSKWDEAINTWDYLKKLRPLNTSETNLYNEAVNRQESLLKQGERIIERQGFVISFDPSFDEQFCELVTDYLIEAKDTLSYTFDVRNDTRINVFAHKATEYSQIHGHNRYAGTRLLNRIDLMIPETIDMSNLKDTIFHEFTHYLASVVCRNQYVPIWFNEGIAQFFETDANLKSVLRSGIRFYKKKKMLTFKDIENLKNLPREDFHNAYVQSNFMFRYLADVSSVERLIKLLEALGRGVPFEDSFKELTGSTQQEFFDRYRPLFKQQLKQMRNKLVPSYKRKKRKE